MQKRSSSQKVSAGGQWEGIRASQCLPSGRKTCAPAARRGLLGGDLSVAPNQALCLMVLGLSSVAGMSPLNCP